MNHNETEPITKELQEKLSSLKAYIKSLGSLAVGFSGGVDSSFLLAVAHETLGDKAIAVTCVDASVPQRELQEAKTFCEERKIRHFICTVDPLKEDGYRFNSPDRCYYCKHCVFSAIKRIAAENDISYLAEGSNVDDLGDYRPGLRAVAELSVTSPLREAGLNKEEIRILSKAMALPTWSKPAFACLASRFVYGEEITIKKLQMIDQAEQYLIEKGFPEVRVRVHDNVARIEVPPKDISRLASEEIRGEVYEKLTAVGFLYVALDLQGYSRGSMNRILAEQKESK